MSSGPGDGKECEVCGEGSGRYRHEGKAFVPRCWDLILWVTGSQAGVRLEVVEQLVPVSKNESRPGQWPAVGSERRR